jgi:Phage integrase, N-terminal SAM-like domain
MNRVRTRHVKTELLLVDTIVMKQITSEFLLSVQEAIRFRSYSIRTEQAYLGWIKRFI